MESQENYENYKSKLEREYTGVKRLILPYQSATTGLFSCNSEKATVEDSIYCSAAVWALGIAFRRIDNDGGKRHELEQSAVKGMRGILVCYMRQADKLEEFKRKQSNEFALSVAYHYWTGDPMPSDRDLRQNVVALFLLYVSQMAASGLEIIYNTDEVAFVQNLVYYLERSYRVPDFGIWGRGTRHNVGSREIHASSVGMAKAALESANGMNLFGKHGAPWSVLAVDMDAHNRNRTVVHTLLPRESNSKSTDAALLSVIGFPFFAIENANIYEETQTKIMKRLLGKYGLKRFVGDGYMTMLEDKTRSFYRPAEIKLFKDIESEWPIFFVYIIIDAMFRGDKAKVTEYQKKLEPLLFKRNDGLQLIPRYFYVEKGNVEAENKCPGSSARSSSHGKFNELPVFLWGQALFLIQKLLVDELIIPRDIDPIGRYVPPENQRRISLRYSTFEGVKSDTVIQVSLIAESKNLQTILSMYGIQTQTAQHLEPIQLWPSQELVKVYSYLGVNKKLGLSGRPDRPIGVLGTSKVYRILGRTIVCYPLLFDVSDFYVAFDIKILLQEIRHALHFINAYWKMEARPLFIAVLKEDIIKEERLGPMLEMLSAFKRGEWEGVKIRLGRVQSFISSCVKEHLEFVRHDDITALDESFFRPFLGLEEEEDEDMRQYSLKRRGSSFVNLTDAALGDNEIEEANELSKQSVPVIVEALTRFQSADAQAILLGSICKREGLNYTIGPITLEQRINRLYRWAAHEKRWSIVRYMASLGQKLVDSLAPAITAVLIKGKQISLGVFGQEEVLIENPVGPAEIKRILYTVIPPYDDREACLQQELVLNVGEIINESPELLRGMLQIRIGWLIYAMKLALSFREGEGINIHDISPAEVKVLLSDVLMIDQTANLTRTQQRRILGALNKVPHNFYQKVWVILERSVNGIVVNGNHMTQEPTMSDMTPWGVMWKKVVLKSIINLKSPQYRQLVVEAMMLIGTVLERNPELSFTDKVDIDAIITETREKFCKEQNIEDPETGERKFYCLSPMLFAQNVSKTIVASLLTNVNIENIDNQDATCSVQ